MDRMRLELGRALSFVDGAPDVSGLPCDKIGSPELGDYMRRYHLEFTRDRAIRFHHIVASDPGEELHDHPWDFVSVMLAGAYTEITPDGTVRYEAPCVITRKAEQMHRLVIDPDSSAWTYVVCGRVRRMWGFATSRGWVEHSMWRRRDQVTGCAGSVTVMVTARYGRRRRKASTPKPPGWTHAHGYGREHQLLRASWKPYVEAGMVECHAIECLEPSRWITPGSTWHLGHTPDRSAWTGPEHALCNTHEGAVRGNKTRGSNGRRSRIW